VMSADEGRPDAGLYFSVPQLVTQSRRHGGTRCAAIASTAWALYDDR